MYRRFAMESAVTKRHTLEGAVLVYGSGECTPQSYLFTPSFQIFHWMVVTTRPIRAKLASASQLKGFLFSRDPGLESGSWCAFHSFLNRGSRDEPASINFSREKLACPDQAVNGVEAYAKQLGGLSWA